MGTMKIHAAYRLLCCFIAAMVVISQTVQLDESDKEGIVEFLIVDWVSSVVISEE